MKIIVISYPQDVAGETAFINTLFENDLQFFHVRKPGKSLAELEQYIQEIPEVFRERIIIHSHYHLVSKYRLKGYHFNKESFHLAGGKDILRQKRKSFSFHSFLEVEECEQEFDYAFLSPVFNSISKNNYKACFDFDELNDFLKNRKNLIALGGVDEDKIEKVYDLGFSGIAVLGAIWNSDEPLQKFIRLKTACDAFRKATLNTNY